MASMLGIALGVMVLITVLSVMNGFNYKVRQEYFAIAPEITITGPRQDAATWAKANREVAQTNGVRTVAPFVTGQGMLSSGETNSGVVVLGIDPSKEMRISQLGKSMRSGSLASLSSSRFNVLLGKGLAEHLGASVGDSITLITPQVSVSPFGAMPRFKRLIVSGIFHAGGGFGFDDSVAYIGLKQAQLIFSSKQATSGLHVRLYDPYAAKNLTQVLQDKLSWPYQVSNWTETNGAFFDALALQKTTMFFVLMLIIAVAVFNLVSSLMMMVNDKRSDIAILRTIGATPGLIMRSFIIQGAVIGIMGTIIGTALGVILSLHVTEVVNFLEAVLHMQIINPTALYGLDYLPSRLQASDVISISTMAFVLSLLATIYPAWSAFRVQPAEALRYE